MGTAHYRRATLTGKRQLTRVFEKGSRFRCNNFTIFVYQNPEIDTFKLAVCIQRKAGNAVTRNRLKRVTRELLDPIVQQMQICHMAILPHSHLLKMSNPEQRQHLLDCLKKTNMFNEIQKTPA